MHDKFKDAKVLLRIKDDPLRMKNVRDRIVAEELSVRATENLCRKSTPNPLKDKTDPKAKTAPLPQSYCNTLTTQLSNHLNTKTRIVQNGKRGKLEIEYYSSDDLDRLLAMLTG